MREKGNQNQDEEEYEYEDEDFGPRTRSHDGKSSEKAGAIRSKHSVTEQRRRSKINERFQMLRELIPRGGDQKRDTASFLLEVIEYVQYLQEKVHKYEGTYQGWDSEPTKLMPWRNSHWRVQSSIGHAQAMKNGSGPGSTLAGRFDENNIASSPTIVASPHNPVESDPSRDVTCKAMEWQPEFANKGLPLPMSLQTDMPASVRDVEVSAQGLHQSVSDVQSDECPITNNSLNHQDYLTIEGGTISISSVYSERLLNTLTQALQNTGIDLSQAQISVQIDLGKRAKRGLNSGTSIVEDFQNPLSSNQAAIHLRDTNSGEDTNQAEKRLKT